MTTRTLGELRPLVQQVLDERGVDTYQWTHLQIIKAFNWSFESATRALGLTPTEIGPVAVSTYLSGSSPANLITINSVITLPNHLAILYVRDFSTMKMLLKTNVQDEDRRDPIWRSKSGTPFAWMDYDGSRIRLNRIPTAGSTYAIGYVEIPTQFTYTGTLATDDAQTVDGRIPLFVQDKLKLAAAAYLLRIAGDHQDMAKADVLTKEFLNQIGADPGPAAKTNVER